MLFCTLTIECSFWTLKTYKLLKTCAPVNTLAMYKYIFWQLPKEWTRPSETSIWNTSPMNMLFCTCIGVIIWNFNRIQTPQNSCPRNHSRWIQVYFLTTSKGMEQTIWNLDWKYFTNEYFIHTLEWSFRILNVCKVLKTRAPVNTLAGYKFTFWQLPREWTSPSETSTGNTSPMKMLFCTLIGVIIWHSLHIQTPKNLWPRNHSRWIQVYFLTTSKGIEQTIWNLNWKYFTNEHATLYTHWSDFEF